MMTEKETVAPKSELKFIENMPTSMIDLLRTLALSENEYYAEKSHLELRKNDLLIMTDWEKELQKKKPTVGEKEAWIQTRPVIVKLAADVRAARIKKNFYQRLFDAVMEDKVSPEAFAPCKDAPCKEV